MNLLRYFAIILISLYLNLFNNHSLLAFSDSGKQEKQGQNAPVKIFYGLNESHSNDWAQFSGDDAIGMVYFDNFNRLIYKTISQSGESEEEIVDTDSHLEVSVLLFDSESNPHVFVAKSDNSVQLIKHYSKDESGEWKDKEIVRFQNEGGKYIYELSAEVGTDDSFHLLALKTRSNPDSDDYYYAYLDAHLYYITNNNNTWTKEFICDYDMIYTVDEYTKAMNRQDIDIDSEGSAHIVYGEQVDGSSWSSPSRLKYVTNKTGAWVSEIVRDASSETRDDPGWFPSISLDNNENPFVSCTYVNRVATGSSMSAKLYLLKRSANSQWNSELVAEEDDGYYGNDGRRFTGGLTSLLFDKDNNPHIVFTDIASSHEGRNYWNLGNVRHAQKLNGQWLYATLYKQAKPTSFYNAKEVYSICGFESNDSTITVVAQELNIASSINIEVEKFTQEAISIDIYDLKGRFVKNIVSNAYLINSSIYSWDGSNSLGNRLQSGIYICVLSSQDSIIASKRIVFNR